MSSYQLRVIPWHALDVARVVELGGSHSLDDLHAAIVEAFELDDDHLYAFFLNGHAWDKEFGYWSAPRRGERGAARTKLDSLRLRVNKRFLYLLDFGEPLHFDVRVVALSPESADPRRPSIITAVGEIPKLTADTDSVCNGHGTPDPALADLAERVRPFVDEWDFGDEDFDDEDFDDEDFDDEDLPEEDFEEAGDGQNDLDVPEDPARLETERSLAIELLDRTGGDLERIHLHLEHTLEANVIGWLASLPFRLVKVGRADAALAIAEMLLAQSDFRSLRLGLPVLLARAGHAGRARAALEENLERDPEDPYALFQAAQACVALGDTDRAESCYREALAFAGDDTLLRLDIGGALAELLERSGREPEAEELARSEAARAKGGERSDLTLAPRVVPVRAEAKIGRNDPCTCGSGKKYKKCCGAA